MAAPRSPGALMALLIAAPFALVLAWSQPSSAPSRAELAKALDRAGQGAITASDIRSIDCAEPDAAGYACRWRQREDGAWLARSGRFAVGASGWRFMDEGRTGERP